MKQRPSPLTFGRTLSVVGLSLLFWGGSSPTSAWAQTRAEEPDLIAAYLNQFAGHVEWPLTEGDTENLILCTLGREEVHEALVEDLQGKRVKGRSVQPAHYTGPDGVEFCHLLFISESEESSWEETRTRLEGRSVLTVSDMDGFVESGGMIGLFWEGKNLRFDINADNTRLADIHPRSRLLGAAERVIGSPGSGRRSERLAPDPAMLPDRTQGGGF